MNKIKCQNAQKGAVTVITVILVDQNSTILKHVTSCLIAMQKRGDIFLFSDLNDFLTNQPKEIDLILLDIDLYELLALPVKLRQKVIALSDNADKATMAYTNHVLGYIPKPLTKSIIQNLLVETIAKHETETIVVNTTEGYVKINVENINYVDIIKRNLCYHLNNNTEVISVTIRKAFKTYVDTLIHNDNFVFIEPAFLINLSQIARIDTDHITFKNGAIVYVNKKQYAKIYAIWSK